MNLQMCGADARVWAEAAIYPEWTPARVIAQYQGLYRVADEQGERHAEVSGKFRYEMTDSLLFPTVGDYVMLSGEPSDERAVIHQVLARRSAFVRAAAGGTGQKQLVAANVDYVFLCMSLNQNFNISRLERYLSIAWSSGATPVVLLTKADLCDETAQRLEEAKRAAGHADVVATSAFDQEACEQVLGYLRPGVTGSFIGSSGVGKSTLINRLMGSEALATAEVGKLDKGRHTTTGRELLALPGGGIVIDTPGMRELGVEMTDLAAAFADIQALEAQCRFRDCAHFSEPGCAVRAALQSGALDERRFESYCKLKRESRYDGKTFKQVEVEKLNAMFKDAGGMKKIRKSIRQNDKRR